MMRLILHNLKHFFITALILLAAAVAFGVYIGADAYYNQNSLAYKVDGEGPHIFYRPDGLSVQTIRGQRPEGFYLEERHETGDRPFAVTARFALESQEFTVQVNPRIATPPAVYDDGAPILALSDIESGFKAFRDFLIAHQVIDAQLNWQFGTGHLVLLGDFVDRGDSVTQVLWLIYKLEQDALAADGRVHFILGNHEIKNLQGNFQSASEKYFHIAAMLGKSQMQLYADDAYIGRWLASKNTIERINGHLFTHGGVHPKVADLKMSLEEINTAIRAHYRRPYFTRKDPQTTDLLISTRTGPAWYRGYFKDNLSVQDVAQGLEPFHARAVVVGHTLQSKVKKLHNGRVYAIDVKHPKDYVSSFPPRRSEGLLIDNGEYLRLLDNGERVPL